MEANGGESSRILGEIENLKSAKSEIERRISDLEAQLRDIDEKDETKTNSTRSCPPLSNGDSGFGHGLSPDMIYRYSRQLLLPSFGVQAQSSLLKASILVVGAGGLGSPALLYLAACGVGRLGIVDHDVVELNNLHRQIIHTEAYIGQSKVESAAAACHSYDIVIDATDNAPSRYLISDCCVVLGKPLVSGAAIGLEGQLTVYNYNGGPCYRCLFPTPPPTTACQRCSDSGVLGIARNGYSQKGNVRVMDLMVNNTNSTFEGFVPIAFPGIIGCHQALEAIKIASDVGEPLSRRMLLFDALTARIRIVKIRGRSSQCEVCGENATFTEKQFQEFDYEKFTQSPLSMTPLKLDLLPTEARISSKEYKERVVRGEPHALVDVRPAHHFKIASLPNSMNVPLSSLEARLPEISSALKREEEHASLYVVCRRGNDSQRAVDYLHKMGFTSAKDIIGGLESWAHDVDPNFPTY
ncbi:unnamed protein product [Camellia sinensis]